MTPLSVLIAARERVATPDRWTRGYWAHDAAGGSCGPADAQATCWCSIGAMIAAVAPAGAETMLDARSLFKAANGINHVPRWNDDPARTHAEVLAAFDLAVELARKEGDQ